MSVLFYFLFQISYLFACMTPNAQDDLSVITYLKCKGLSISNVDFPKEEINFGVQVGKSGGLVYRSAGLGKKGSDILGKHLATNYLPFPTKVIYLNSYGYTRAFGLFDIDFALTQMENPVLYDPISKEAYPYEFLHPFDPKNIGKTYVSGKNPLQDKDFRAWVFDENLKTWYITQEGGILNILYVLRKILEHHQTQQAVLIHCKGGIHRTGMIMYLLRGIMDSHWLDQGTTFPIFPFYRGKIKMENPAQFEYYLHNKKSYRQKNIDSVQTMTKMDWYRCLQGLESFETKNLDYCLN